MVDGQKQLDKILAIRAELPNLVAIVMYNGDVARGTNDGLGDGQAKVYSWEQFMACGGGSQLPPRHSHCHSAIYRVLKVCYLQNSTL